MTIENDSLSETHSEDPLATSLVDLSNAETFDDQGFVDFVTGLDPNSRFRLFQLAITGLNSERQPNQPVALSHRQSEVLAMLASGKANKEIARSLSITSKAAEFHVARIMLKFGVHRRSDAVLEAHRAGFLP